METVRPEGPREQIQVQRHGQATDARAGESHPRTAAGPSAAPKLVKRTFLVAPSPAHSTTRPHIAATWSIRIHDFGTQWVEASWGLSDPRPGKKGCKGRSPNRIHNEKRARARATGAIRRKCITIGADHLVTLTYRDNVANRDRVLRDLDRLRRMLTRAGYPMPFVAVLECQRRGAIHPHLAVRGFQDVRLLRRCWYKIVGQGQGQVNVRGPRPGSSPVKLARYLSKYIAKDLESLPREFGEHRYFSSLGITVPTERFQIIVGRHAANVEERMFSLVFREMLRRVGEYSTLNQWSGGAGTYGWMAGFADPSTHWIRTPSSPLPPPTSGHGAQS
jgi:hypothetical protein